MLFSPLDDLIHQSIRQGFPGAQILVAHKGAVILHRAYGCSSLYPERQAAHLSTFYDIASLTKIFSITYAFQYLVTHEHYDLDQTLVDCFPEYFANDQWSDKRLITIRALLTHQAGFEANPLYYDPAYSRILFSQNHREGFIEKLLATPLIYQPLTQVRYSDVDFMLLTFVLERFVGQQLDVWLSQHFWRPLKISEIAYTPLNHGILPADIAATERHGNTRDGAVYFDHIRTYPLQGEVQDEKAYHCMAGISGHAGLFATTNGLYHLLQPMVTASSFFSSAVTEIFLTPVAYEPTFGLGWRLNRDPQAMAYHFGDYASQASFGHTGWTGCMMMIDPDQELIIIYLTNRKHTIVIDPQNAPNVFLGDTLPAGKYRIISNIVYECLGLRS